MKVIPESVVHIIFDIYVFIVSITNVVVISLILIVVYSLKY